MRPSSHHAPTPSRCTPRTGVPSHANPRRISRDLSVYCVLQVYSESGENGASEWGQLGQFWGRGFWGRGDWGISEMKLSPCFCAKVWGVGLDDDDVCRWGEGETFFLRQVFWGWGCLGWFETCCRGCFCVGGRTIRVACGWNWGYGVLGIGDLEIPPLLLLRDRFSRNPKKL